MDELWETVRDHTKLPIQWGLGPSAGCELLLAFFPAVTLSKLCTTLPEERTASTPTASRSAERWSTNNTQKETGKRAVAPST
jgi:hypothetical protein